MNHPYPYSDQVKLMSEQQDVLRTALNFTCQRINYRSAWRPTIWYDRNNKAVAYANSTGIIILPERHDFAWNAFKLFL